MRLLGRTPATVVVSTGPPVDVRSNADLLEVHMLSALAKLDATLAAWSLTHRPQELVDGLLDVRNRLTKGLPT